jgi:hypothetical protein
MKNKSFRKGFLVGCMFMTLIIVICMVILMVVTYAN